MASLVLKPFVNKLSLVQQSWRCSINRKLREMTKEFPILVRKSGIGRSGNFLGPIIAPFDNRDLVPGGGSSVNIWPYFGQRAQRGSTNLTVFK